MSFFLLANYLHVAMSVYMSVYKSVYVSVYMYVYMYACVPFYEDRIHALAMT